MIVSKAYRGVRCGVSGSGLDRRRLVDSRWHTHSDTNSSWDLDYNCRWDLDCDSRGYRDRTRLCDSCWNCLCLIDNSLANGISVTILPSQCNWGVRTVSLKVELT